MFSRRQFLIGAGMLFSQQSIMGWATDVPVESSDPINLVAGKAVAYIRGQQVELTNNGESIAGKVTADIQGVSVPMLGYNGQTPGPTITATEGGRIRVNLHNTMDNMATSVHWHGVRIDNAMDGTPPLTQQPVLTGEKFLYDFIVPDAGTYWYHTHHRSLLQLEQGLYGPLIVHEKNPPIVDHDIIVMLDDWRLTKDGTQDLHFDDPFDVFFAGRIGNVAQAIFRHLGREKPIYKGDRIRFRIINTATDRIFDLRIKGVRGKGVALDGAPVSVPFDVDKIDIAPAQRCDIIVDVTDEKIAFITRRNRQDYPLGDLKTHGDRGKISIHPILPLPPRTMERKPDLQHAVRVVLDMDGGNMGRELDHGAWSLNGTSGMHMQKPLFRVKRGQTVLLQIKNHTAFHHAMHTHGHHFYRVQNGKLTTHRDTIVVLGDTNRDIAIRCDNPGKWMLHCHMLTHSENGMMSWFEVM